MPPIVDIENRLPTQVRRQSEPLDVKFYVDKALKEKDLRVLVWLFDVRDVKPDLRYKANKTLLHLTAQHDALILFKYLVEHKKLDVTAKADQGNMPIHEASFYGSLSVLRHLIEEKKMDVNIVNAENETPLIKAAANDQLEVAKYLVQRGANIQKRSKKSTALEMAKRSKGRKVAEYLEGELSRRAKETITNFSDLLAFADQAFKNRDLVALRFMIERGVPPYYPLDGGKLFLHLAARDNNLPFVEYFIDTHQIDPNVRDIHGDTPIHEAAYFDAKNVMRYLVERKGVDINTRNNHLETPLHKAAWAKKPEIVRYLLEKGANVNAKDFQGRTPLDLANIHTYFYNREVIELLIPKTTFYSRPTRSLVQHEYPRVKREIVQAIPMIDQQVNDQVKRIGSPNTRNDLIVNQNLNGTLMLVNVIMSKFSGVKMTGNEKRSQSNLTNLEVQSLALNVCDKFEKVLIKTADHLNVEIKNFDPITLVSQLKSELTTANSNQLIELLMKTAHHACPKIKDHQDARLRLKGELEDYLNKEIVPNVWPQSINQIDHSKPLDFFEDPNGISSEKSDQIANYHYILQ